MEKDNKLDDAKMLNTFISGFSQGFQAHAVQNGEN